MQSLPLPWCSDRVMLGMLGISAVAQYSEWTVGPFSCATCPPMFMQFTGCHQPVRCFYWPESAINWLRQC